MKPVDKLLSLEKVRKLFEKGSRVMVGGFGGSGAPTELIEVLSVSGAKELTVISNDLGTPGVGLGVLLRNGQLKSLIGTYYTWNPEVAESANAGIIQVRLVPQGTFAEAIRAAGMGIPAFYTATSYGTELGRNKEVRQFKGRDYVLEECIEADIALIKAHRADLMGNLSYYKTANNFNPLMAMAARITIAQVDEIVTEGCLPAGEIHTPHIFVDGLVRGGKSR